MTDKIKGWRLAALWLILLPMAWAVFTVLGLTIREGVKWLLH